MSEGAGSQGAATDPGPLARIGQGLCEAVGYDFYRAETRMRADDQKVRALVSAILAAAHQAIVAAEGEYRRTRIPPPTRAQPFPDPAILADAHRLEAMARAVDALEGQVRHAPAPEQDRMTRRYRDERETLMTLVEKDQLLVGLADALRARVVGQGPDTLLSDAAAIDSDIAGVAELLAARQILLV